MDSAQVFSRIKNQNNNKLAFLEEMKKSSLPLILYGTGDYAHALLLLLKKYDVSVLAACVDDDYYNHENAVWNGLQVYPISKLSNSHNLFNTLIGFSHFKEAEKKMQAVKGCNSIYFLDTTMHVFFFDYAYVKQNWELFYDTYRMLGDEMSKKTMLAYINGQIAGRAEESYTLIDKNQYFTNEIMSFTADETFVDAGAFNGDTIRKFLDVTRNKYCKIYALEPDRSNCADLQVYVHDACLLNVEVLNIGAWSKKDKLSFSADAGNTQRSLLSNTGSVFVEVDAIDNVLNGTQATFIKMDIEGAELAALKGAENTIKNFRPKLAICVYHKPEDLIQIPQYLKSIIPDYRFYLRQHLHLCQELVLYAI